MRYPNVFSEEATLEYARSMSIARYGDGELRLALGGTCISQREKSKKMVHELKTILSTPVDGLLACIPNVYSATPRRESWLNYAESRFLALYPLPSYGSAFITRPDSAPWIDVPAYWEKVQELWKGKEITLVVGDKKSVTSEMIGGTALTLREVWGPRQNAYAEIDRIEQEIGTPSGTVLLCMGVTATILAWRLAKKGVHAIDLGHIGMFMRHAGAYRYQLADLVTSSYRKQLAGLHEKQKWGNGGKKHAEAVRGFVNALDAKTILDYGCGMGTLAEALHPLRVSGYDPGVPGKEGMPKPCDLVVCTDVLEHVEDEKVDAVIDHLYRLTAKGAYVVIATRVANAVLPDGRNAHLTVKPDMWWLDKLKAAGFAVQGMETRPGHEVKLWLTTK